MAKPRRSKRTAEPEPSLTERIEQQELASLVRSAQAKIQQGQTASLSRAEKGALATYERMQLETYGLRYFRRMPKADAIDHLGSSSKVVTDNRERRGFPWPTGRRDPVDVQSILRWLWRYFLETEPATHAADADGDLLRMASDELKDELIRERIEERKIANEQRRVELAALIGSYRPAEMYETLLGEMAEVIRRKRLELGKRLDGHVGEVVDRAFDDLADTFERIIEESLGDGDDQHPA